MTCGTICLQGGFYVLLVRGYLCLLVECDVDVGERVPNSVSVSCFDSRSRSRGAGCAGVAGVA
jgi:hypothetical protein